MADKTGKKRSKGQISSDRILAAAIDLIGENGYDATSIRQIAGVVGMNEASLYNHFDGKAALLEGIFNRLDELLIMPGLADPGKDSEEKGVEEIIRDGAARFFGLADREAMKIWRILIMEQYRSEKAKRFIREKILEFPRGYFASLFRELRKKGKIRSDVEPEAAADALAAIYFEFSFTSNLSAAWNEPNADNLQRLRGAVSFFAQAISAH